MHVHVTAEQLMNCRPANGRRHVTQFDSGALEPTAGRACAVGPDERTTSTLLRFAAATISGMV